MVIISDLHCTGIQSSHLCISNGDSIVLHLAINPLKSRYSWRCNLRSQWALWLLMSWCYYSTSRLVSIIVTHCCIDFIVIWRKRPGHSSIKFMYLHLMNACTWHLIFTLFLKLKDGFMNFHWNLRVNQLCFINKSHHQIICHVGNGVLHYTCSGAQSLGSGLLKIQ